MYNKVRKCKTCDEKFKEYPIKVHTTKRVFCSEACLPEAILDEYGAWDYVDYVYAYREYAQRIQKVQSKYQQEES